VKDQNVIEPVKQESYEKINICKYLINYEVADDWNFATLSSSEINHDHGLGG